MRDRKLEHIKLTEKSQTLANTKDQLFSYEPLLHAHPKHGEKMEVTFLGKRLDYPIWISSMTGGTGKAAHINENLSKLAGKYGLGMGLGSCRMLLNNDDALSDFALRGNIGNQPFWANLGVAQVQELLEQGQLYKIEELVTKLDACGLIIHINPLQEWFQPEGDVITTPPIETIENFLKSTQIPLIVKEVGQGMGPASLEALMRLPIAAIEFAAYGGTNFSLLEKHRNSNDLDLHSELINVGHTALEMVEISNSIIVNLGPKALCKNFIISGGIRSYMQGLQLIKLSKGNAVFGMASPFLKFADQGFLELDHYTSELTRGLVMANRFLTVKE